jgi:hypothetical protein
MTNGLNKEGTIAYEIDNEYCIILVDSEDGNEINYWYGFVAFHLR